MWNLIEDLEYGKIRERLIVAYLNENIYIEDNLNLYQNEKKQVDFRNEEILGELKSRTFKHDKYITTFFGYNKLKYLESLENDNRVWKFYFFFTDGLYVWTYNKDQYEIRDYEHRERGVIDQVYIDIKYLECLTRKIKNMDTPKLMNEYKEYFNQN
tara:strand:- start:12 stop:479 length:468 start_codon:yes stop_codon:yes gene_type:complete